MQTSTGARTQLEIEYFVFWNMILKLLKSKYFPNLGWWINLTEIVFHDVVNEVLSGFDNKKMVTCPICRASIDLIGQDLESESDVYVCANCGFKVKRSLHK